MNIEWNKVTWYSKLLAVVLFVLTFYIGFNLGKESAEVNSISVPTISQLPANKLITTATYACKAGKTIVASYYESENKPVVNPGEPPIPIGSVVLKLSDGRAMTLPQTLSADGARYANADESIVFWSKGNGLTFTENGKETYLGCVENAK